MTQFSSTSAALETIAQMTRDCLRAVPVIVLGSGASLAHGLPSTSQLTEHLLDHEPSFSRDSNAASLWESVTARLSEGADLEEALHHISLPAQVQDYIVALVWHFVQERDAEGLNAIIESETRPALTRLYDYFFDTSETELSVVTTNYDRIAEYAADVSNRWHYAGFPPGYFRSRHSPHPYKILEPRIGTTSTEIRKANIWKVHGSLDWFTRTSGDTISITAAHKIPAGCKPAIITPGLNKYDQALQEPFRSVLAGADRALDTARAYLCIGYGFNDRHIHPRLVRRWRDGHATLLIVARSLTEKAVEILSDPRQGRFLAITDTGTDSTGTRIVTNLDQDLTELPDAELWHLQGFVESLL